MYRNVERRAHQLVRERILECDRPGNVRFLAIAATRSKAAQPSKCVTEGNARREYVTSAQYRHLVASDVPQARDNGSNQAAIENAACLQHSQAEDLAGMDGGKAPVV